MSGTPARMQRTSDECASEIKHWARSTMLFLSALPDGGGKRTPRTSADGEEVVWIKWRPWFGECRPLFSPFRSLHTGAVASK